LKVISPDVDLGNAIAVFQCANDVIFIRIFVSEICIDAEGQRWPDI
jgi:hypothetical protein